MDELLHQALALVGEDQRGELADVIEQIINEVREDFADDAYESGYSKALEDDFVVKKARPPMSDTLSLDIRAEQLTTAYELAKDEGLRGDELNAVVVRHLKDARRAALEEAAQVTKRLVTNMWGWQWGDTIASAVRALISQEPTP